MEEKSNAAPPAPSEGPRPAAAPLAPDGLPPVAPSLHEDGQPKFSQEEVDQALARAEAPPRKLTTAELVAKHLDETSKLEPHQLPDNYRLLVEHAEEAGLEPWQMRAVLARFHAHGLRELSRLHPDVFRAALHDALHGRI